MLSVVFISGCAISSGLPLTVDSYCAVTKKHYPIMLSRKDTAETKRQVAVANSTYETLCKVKEPTNGK